MLKQTIFFITMGDIPNIGQYLYRKSLNTILENPEIDIARLLLNGKLGHPVLLKKSLIPAILSEPDTSEMKTVFTHHRVLDIEPELPDSFSDIDTLEDYRKLIGSQPNPQKTE